MPTWWGEVRAAWPGKRGVAGSVRLGRADPAWREKVRYGRVRRGEVRPAVARCGRPGGVRRGWARLGMVRMGTARPTRPGLARSGAAGMAELGKVWRPRLGCYLGLDIKFGPRFFVGGSNGG
jgi:hypothetical protein